MNILHALILGIVEGLTEFLPISSTAHLEIAARLLGLAQSDFVKTFEIVIQFGAILAVIVLYFSILIKDKEIWKRITVAFIPTAIIGFVLYKIIKNVFLGNYFLLVLTLGIGGLILIVFEYIHRDRESLGNTDDELRTLPYKKAFIIGLVQALAVIPGVSRWAASIGKCPALNVSRQAIVEFSFLLAVPTIAAAAGYDLLKSASTLSVGGQNSVLLLAVGFVASFISALLAIKFFINFVKNRSLTSFGIYRIILAVVLFMVI